MTAPHEQLTDREQSERAMRLAAILMRPSDFPHGLNQANPPLAAMREARRRMVEARWDDAVPWLDARIAPLDKYAEERAVIDRVIAAGQCADSRVIGELAQDAGMSVSDVPEAHAFDENGNMYFVRYWLRPEDSPWRRIAVPAYRALLRDLFEVTSGRSPEYLRKRAAYLWELMTDEERAAVA